MDAPSDDYASSRHSKFKFKSKSKRKHSDEDAEDLGRPTKKRRSWSPRREHSHRHRRRRKEKDEGPNDGPAAYDDSYVPNSASENRKSAKEAFQESLFDALADDEGAAYWEGVYGQPIHTYSRAKTGPLGELEQMTDDEYASYVRGKMYEKTHAHIIEERQRREEARKNRRKLKEEAERLEEERESFQRQVDESLKKGKERKSKKQTKEAWDRYATQWDQFKDTVAKLDPDASELEVERSIPWPVSTGNRKDVSKEHIKAFFKSSPVVGDFANYLKLERVRWHPDKMMQRFGGRNVSEETMQSITAVFQIIDDLWSDTRG